MSIENGNTNPNEKNPESNKNNFIQDITEQIQEQTKSLSQHSEKKKKSLMFQIILKNKDNFEKGYTTVRI